MRKRIAASLVVLAWLGATPAAAQIVGPRDYGPVARANPFLPDSRPAGPSAADESQDLRERIGAAREAGTISRREARALDREARLIGRLGLRYGRDGLSGAERAELETRAAALRARVNRPRG